MSYKTSNLFRTKVAPLNLSLAAVAVGYALSSVMPLDERGSVAVTIETLMKWTNTSKNTVRKGLKELVLNGVYTARAGKRFTDLEGKIRSKPTLYTWGPVSSEHWVSADLNTVAAESIVIDETAQNIDLNRGSQIDPVKERVKELANNESAKDWLLLATLVNEALEHNPSPTVISLGEAIVNKPQHVAERLERVMAKCQWNRPNFMAAALSKTPEQFLPELRKSPHVGELRDWVLPLHNTGEHFECRPGEFGHPEGEPIELDLLPEGVSPWAAYPWVGKG